VRTVLPTAAVVATECRLSYGLYDKSEAHGVAIILYSEACHKSRHDRRSQSLEHFFDKELVFP
jgi:hypothetical protein